MKEVFLWVWRVGCLFFLFLIWGGLLEVREGLIKMGRYVSSDMGEISSSLRECNSELSSLNEKIISVESDVDDLKKKFNP